MKITNGKDSGRGMFIAFGLGFLLFADRPAPVPVELAAKLFDYSSSTDSNGERGAHGTGVFSDRCLGGILAVLGAAVLARGFRGRDIQSAGCLPVRAWLVAAG